MLNLHVLQNIQYKVYKPVGKNVNVYYQRLLTFLISFVINAFIIIFWTFSTSMPVYVGSTGHRYSAMALLEGRVSGRNVWGGGKCPTFWRTQSSQQTTYSANRTTVRQGLHLPNVTLRRSLNNVICIE